MRYAKFVEDNDHEGESWTFWLQIDGNEGALDVLVAVLEQYEEQVEHDSEYQLVTDVKLSDHDVDVLVDHGGGDGYMANHTKVTGVLTVPDGLLERTEYGPSLDRLYKGGVKNLYSAVAS